MPMFQALALASIIFVSGPSFGPSDEMFEELKNAPTEEEATSVALELCRASSRRTAFFIPFPCVAAVLTWRSDS